MDAALQLWSVRLATEEFGWAKTLDRVAESGFGQVEPYAINFTVRDIAPELDRLDLKSPTAHGFLDADQLDDTLDAAEALSVSYIAHPHLDVDAWEDAAALDRTAEMLTCASAAAQDRGISVGFHNHDHELRHLVDGEVALFALMDRLPPEVMIEFDIYWSAIAGAQPLDILARLDGRVRALHVKDGPFGGTAADQVALGDGALALDAVLAAVPESTSIVLSLDRMPGTANEMWTAIQRSRTWLNERGIG